MKLSFLPLCVLALGGVNLADPAVFPDAPAEALARVSVAEGEVVYAIVRDEGRSIVARRRGDAAPPTIVITPPSGYVVMSPAVSPDGRLLYFESNVREKGLEAREDTDVWVVERVAGAWGTPRPLGPPFDSRYNEHFPTVDRAGTLCFNSGRPGTRENDIFCGPLDGSESPRLVDAVNSAAEDASPWLSPAGDLLVFASNRPEGMGGWDLYVSHRSATGWSAARNLGVPVNSARDEFGVSLSPQGDRLFYLRYGGGGVREVLTAALAPLISSVRSQ